MSENHVANRVASESTADPVRSSPAGSQKWLVGGLWLVMALVVVGVIVAKVMEPLHEPMPILFQPAPFSLTDQDGKAFSSEQLRGRVYICDFIFTTCGMVCPIMSQRLSAIQRQTPAAVHLVSFTVDPAHDTPAVLKEYASHYAADPTRWHFLTGTPEQMTAAVANMKLAFQAAGDRNPIVHSEMFLLIDRAGNVRGVYDSKEEKAINSLLTDARWLCGLAN